MNWPVFTVCSLPALALVLASSAAAADPPKPGGDASRAEALFYEARSLMAKKNYAEACPKFEESMRLDAGIGTRFNLADCNEQIGKLATARAGFLTVAEEAKRANQPEREKIAQKRADALEGRVPKLVIEVPSSLPGLTVKRDGVLVAGSTYGVPGTVDPGTHRVEVTAPGKMPWQTEVQAIEGKTARVKVPQDLVDVPAAAGPAVVTPGIGPPESDPATTGVTSASFTNEPEYFPPAVTEEPGTTQRTIGWVVVATGAVGLGIGGAFGLNSLSSRDESRQYCTADLCNAQGLALRDDAIRDGNVSTGLMIGGAAAVAGGLLLVFTAPRHGASETASAKLRAAPTVGQRGGGLSLQGRFQ